MKILVSACLLGENCKYSGGSNNNQHNTDTYNNDYRIIPCIF